MHGNESNGPTQLAPNRIAEWILLLVQLPGQSARPSGVLLLDPVEDELHVALIDAVSADADIAEIWDSLREDLVEKSLEIGGARLLASLEADLSLFLQLEGQRQNIATSDPKRTLQILFHTHVRDASAFSRATQSGAGD